MPDILGCVDNQAYQVLFTEEIGGLNPVTGASDYGRTVGAVDQFTELVWDRRLDDTSEAVLTIPTNAECCQEILADLHVWHHGIAIYRNGELVWDGPIVRIATSRTQVVITAHDVSALLAKRLLTRDICFSNDEQVCTGGDGGLVFGPRSPEFVAYQLIQDAIRYDSHGIIVTLLEQGTDIFEASYLQYGGPVFDLLQKLATDFINWTVLGRRIVIFRGGLSTSDNTFARTSLLTCEDFVNDVFETVEDGLAALTWDAQISDLVVEDGTEVTNKSIGIYKAFLNSQVADPYYGLLQGIQDGNRALAVGGDADPSTTLALAAKSVVAGSYPPPVSLSTDGLQFSVNAPVTIAELVPGTIIPIVADCLCRPFNQDFILSKVTVTFNVDGETVEPTLITQGSDNPGDFTEF